MHDCLLNRPFGFSHWSILRFLKIEVLLGQTSVLIKLLIVF